MVFKLIYKKEKWIDFVRQFDVIIRAGCETIHPMPNRLDEEFPIFARKQYPFPTLRQHTTFDYSITTDMFGVMYSGANESLIIDGREENVMFYDGYPNVEYSPRSFDTILTWDGISGGVFCETCKMVVPKASHCECSEEENPEVHKKHIFTTIREMNEVINKYFPKRNSLYDWIPLYSYVYQCDGGMDAIVYNINPDSVDYHKIGLFTAGTSGNSSTIQTLNEFERQTYVSLPNNLTGLKRLLLPGYGYLFDDKQAFFRASNNEKKKLGHRGAMRRESRRRLKSVFDEARTDDWKYLTLCNHCNPEDGTEGVSRLQGVFASGSRLQGVYHLRIDEEMYEQIGHYTEYDSCDENCEIEHSHEENDPCNKQCKPGHVSSYSENHFTGVKKIILSHPDEYLWKPFSTSTEDPDDPYDPDNLDYDHGNIISRWSYVHIDSEYTQPLRRFVRRRLTGSDFANFY